MVEQSLPLFFLKHSYQAVASADQDRCEDSREVAPRATGSPSRAVQHPTVLAQRCGLSVWKLIWTGCYLCDEQMLPKLAEMKSVLEDLCP